MKIALVTAFPPSRQALNEYGFHIAEELRQQPGIDLTVLGDTLTERLPELPEFSVVRCWGFNQLGNPVSLVRAIQRVKPDVVWYNLGFASFGGKPLHQKRPPFFRSYGGNLPSSLTRVLPIALVFSTCPPESVWGTGTVPAR